RARTKLLRLNWQRAIGCTPVYRTPKPGWCASAGLTCTASEPEPPKERGNGTGPWRALKMSQSFEWDEAKARANQQKHSVSFDEASTVFANPLAAIFPDPDHSQDELREIIVGHSERNR